MVSNLFVEKMLEMIGLEACVYAVFFVLWFAVICVVVSMMCVCVLSVLVVFFVV